MPVLKWINDSYDAEIDKPNQYRKDITHTLYKRPAGTFFRPNRAGEFLIYNMSMHMRSHYPIEEFWRIARQSVDRPQISIKGQQSLYLLYVFVGFPSSCRGRWFIPELVSLRRQTTGLITPEFTVEEGKTWSTGKHLRR